MTTPRAPTRPRLLLVVDRDERTAAVLARLLRSDGYEAEAVTTSSAAIARLESGRAPDAVIAELRPPIAAGIAIARSARGRSARMPIIFVTAHPHACTAGTLAVGEPVSLVTKPLDYAELVRVLGAALAVSKS